MDRKVNYGNYTAFIIILSVVIFPVKPSLAHSPLTELPKSLKIDGYKLIRVNPGSFTMGAPNMPPRAEPFEGLREVKMDKVFYLGETEVTQSLWERYMKINPSRFQSPSLPVEGVTWKDAMEFCAKLNKIKDTLDIPEGMIFRLPSEAEWEYAARAGSKSTFSLERMQKI